MKSVESLYPYVLTPTSSRDYFSWQKHEPILLPHPKAFDEQQLQALRNPTARLDGHRSNPSWRQSHQPVKKYEKNVFMKQVHAPRQQENQPGQSEYIIELPYDAIGHNVKFANEYFGASQFVGILNAAGGDCSGITGFTDLEASTYQIQCFSSQIDIDAVVQSLVLQYNLEFKNKELKNEISALIPAEYHRPTPTPTLVPTETPVPTPIRTPTPPNLPPNVSDAQATDIYAAQLNNFAYQLTQAPTPTEILVNANRDEDYSSLFWLALIPILVGLGFGALRDLGNAVNNLTSRGKNKS